MRYSRRRPPRFLFLFIPLLIGVLGAVVMVLWNALLPDILGVKPISYWQALGLFLLSRILLGGFRGGGGSPPWKGSRRGRWTSLSEEEKAKIKSEWQTRCRPR